MRKLFFVACSGIAITNAQWHHYLQKPVINNDDYAIFMPTQAHPQPPFSYQPHVEAPKKTFLVEASDDEDQKLREATARVHQDSFNLGILRLKLKAALEKRRIQESRRHQSHPSHPTHHVHPAHPTNGKHDTHPSHENGPHESGFHKPQADKHFGGFHATEVQKDKHFGVFLKDGPDAHNVGYHAPKAQAQAKPTNGGYHQPKGDQHFGGFHTIETKKDNHFGVFLKDGPDAHNVGYHAPKTDTKLRPTNGGYSQPKGDQHFGGFHDQGSHTHDEGYHAPKKEDVKKENVSKNQTSEVAEAQEKQMLELLNARKELEYHRAEEKIREATLKEREVQVQQDEDDLKATKASLKEEQEDMKKRLEALNTAEKAHQEKAHDLKKKETTFAEVLAKNNGNHASVAADAEAKARLDNKDSKSEESKKIEDDKEAEKTGASLATMLEGANLPSLKDVIPKITLNEAETPKKHADAEKHLVPPVTIDNKKPVEEESKGTTNEKSSAEGHLVPPVSIDNQKIVEEEKVANETASSIEKLTELIPHA